MKVVFGIFALALTIFRQNATHCILPYAVVVCLCLSVCVCVSVCRVCGRQENGLR